jgi:N-acetylmuramic acid 6-phosphate etherase
MLDNLETEKSNPKTRNLDDMDIYEILRIINQEDATIALSVAENLENITNVVVNCISAIKNHGRIIYVGAGTSGRVAVVDAVETVPTFGIDSGIFLPLIAGGEKAFFQATEHVEDYEEGGKKDLEKNNIRSEDYVIGITASGRTPYVKGALSKAKELGCKTALICNVKNPELMKISDIVVSLRTGPEVIAGSTRMKAGTAQKMVLNMISTVTMIKLGKTFKNYMVDVKIMNQKLEERAVRIISEVTGLDKKTCKEYLIKADMKPKLAILMILSGKDKEFCIEALKKNEVLNEALKTLKN